MSGEEQDPPAPDAVGEVLAGAWLDMDDLSSRESPPEDGLPDDLAVGTERPSL